MKHIKILGMGCPSCKKTEEIIKDYLRETNTQATIEKVEELEKIIAYNILTTPVVVVDEVIKIKGKVPNFSEIEAALR